MELGRQFILDNVHVAFESDGAEAPPMSSPYEDVNSPTEALSKFDGISYNKGSNINNAKFQQILIITSKPKTLFALIS